MSDEILVGADPRVGITFAGYKLEALLGRGEHSVVYRATSKRTRGPLALKLIQTSSHHDPEFGARLLKETKLVSTLDHPNLVQIFDTGEANGFPYVAMAYIDGFDLRTALSLEGGLEPGQAVAMIGGVADALDTARWARGLVHGNVKPSNILIPPDGDPFDGGRAVLTDFGTRASIVDDQQPESVTQSSGLTSIAPEQIDGRPANPRSDVYALGCVLYECLTGQPPYLRTTAQEILKAHLHAEPPRTALNAKIDRVIARALAKWPEERYSTCAELALEAERALVTGSSSATLRAARPLPQTAPLPELPPPAVPAKSVPVPLPDEEPTARAEPRSRISPRGLVAALILGLGLAALIAASLVFTGDAEEVIATPPQASSFASAPAESVAGARAPLQIFLPAEENTLIKLNSTGKITDFLQPTGLLRYDSPVAYGRNAVWIATPNEGTVSRVGLESPGSTDTYRVRGFPRLIGLGHGSVWVVSAERRAQDDRLVNEGVGVVSRISPRSGESLATVEIDYPRPVALAVGPSGVWIAATNSDGHAVLRVDPETDAVAATIPIQARPVALAATDNAVWVAGRGPWVNPWDPLRNTLTRIDPATNTIVATIELDHPPGGSRAAVALQDETVPSAGDGAVWVASKEGTLMRVRPATNRIAGTIRVEDPVLRDGIAGVGVAVADGWVWIASSYHRHVLRIDPDEGEITETIVLPRRPNSIDSVGDDVWVTVTPPERVG